MIVYNVSVDIINENGKWLGSATKNYEINELTNKSEADNFIIKLLYDIILEYNNTNRNKITNKNIKILSINRL